MENTSEKLTKTSTESSIENNQALENLNIKLLEIMIDRGKLPSYLKSPVSIITMLENTKFKLFKNSSSTKVYYLFIHKTLPITRQNNLLTFRDTGKEFELQGVLFKIITNKNYNVHLASLADKKLMYDFAKEMHFDVRGPGNKSTRDRTLIKLPKSPGLIASASGISNKILLPSDPDELCDRLK